MGVTGFIAARLIILKRRMQAGKKRIWYITVRLIRARYVHIGIFAYSFKKYKNEMKILKKKLNVFWGPSLVNKQTKI